jgi:hypothetical protein
VVALALALAAAALVDAAQRGPAAVGLALAWAASSISLSALLYGRSKGFSAFMWAFGGGVALRGFVLAALMVRAWGRPFEWQAAILASYTLGCLALMLVEIRNLNVVPIKINR